MSSAATSSYVLRNPKRKEGGIGPPREVVKNAAKRTKDNEIAVTGLSENGTMQYICFFSCMDMDATALENQRYGHVIFCTTIEVGRIVQAQHNQQYFQGLMGMFKNKTCWANWKTEKQAHLKNANSLSLYGESLSLRMGRGGEAPTRYAGFPAHIMEQMPRAFRHEHRETFAAAGIPLIIDVSYARCDNARPLSLPESSAEQLEQQTAPVTDQQQQQQTPAADQTPATTTPGQPTTPDRKITPPLMLSATTYANIASTADPNTTLGEFRARVGLKKTNLAMTKIEPTNNDKPKELCSFYAKGTCRYGKKCRFIHDPLTLTDKKP